MKIVSVKLRTVIITAAVLFTVVMLTFFMFSSLSRAVCTGDETTSSENCDAAQTENFYTQKM